MLTGLSKDIRDIDGARKTAVISRELVRLKVDIAALQEMRIAGCGSLTEKEYTFFWQGRDEDEPRVHGIAFAVSNKLVQMVEPGSTKSERIMHIKLNTDLGPTNLLSVYAPTLTSSTDAKDTFYSQLDDAIKHIPNNEVLILLGDFNARVGNDQGSWPDCLGHFWSFAPIITSVLQTHSLAGSCTIGSRGCTPDLKTGTNSTSSSQDGNTLIIFILQGHTTVLIVTLITPLSARRSSYVQRSSIASNNLLHFALMLLPPPSLKMSLFSTTS